MTEKDKDAIIAAEMLPPAYWMEVHNMALEADTPEAREALESISRRLYHEEEAQDGNI